MKVVFNLEVEDLKLFQEKYRSFHPGFIHLRLLQSIFGPSMILFCLYIVSNSKFGLVPLYIMIIPAILLGFYLWRYSPGLWVKSNLDEQNAKGKLDGIVGINTLIIEENGIREINGAGEKLTFWNRFFKTYKFESHFFLIDKLQNSIIIPKHYHPRFT